MAELDEMKPYEREIYIALLNKHIEEKNKKAQQRK